MQEKPKVGIIFMRSDWQDCPDAQPVLTTIQSDTQLVLNRLGAHFDLIGPWVVDTPDALHACSRAVRDSDMDMVLLAFQTWTDDTHLVSLLQAIGTRPLVLWCYVPWRRVPGAISASDVLRGSGPVGTIGALGTLRNLGVPFLFTFGGVEDPRLIHDLVVAGQAARMRQALRGARFGLIPSRSSRMQSAFVDEFRLMTDFGPVVQAIPVNEYKHVADGVAPERVTAYLKQLTGLYPVRNLAPDLLAQAAQAALGMADLAVAHRLNLAAVNDGSQDLHRTFGLRPSLYPDITGLPDDLIFQPVADLGAATANYILHCLTGSPTLFLEIWFWDEARNVFIGGHGGLQNPELGAPGQVSLIPDRPICTPGGLMGAQFQFSARPGRVTLFQIRSTPRGWQAVAASGVCLEGQNVVQDHPHAVIRMDATIEHMLNRLAEVGAAQHWVMAYGSVLHEIEAFCQMEKIPLEILTY